MTHLVRSMMVTCDHMSESTPYSFVLICRMGFCRLRGTVLQLTLPGPSLAVWLSSVGLTSLSPSYGCLLACLCPLPWLSCLYRKLFSLVFAPPPTFILLSLRPSSPSPGISSLTHFLSSHLSFSPHTRPTPIWTIL